MEKGLFLGSPMAGRIGKRICAVCSHIHERVDKEGERELTWIAGCWCGCTASSSEYAGETIPLDDYQPDLADILATAVREHDKSDDLCPVHHVAGPCAGSVDSHPRPVRPVVARCPVRVGWMDRFVWLPVSRFLGHFSTELVGKWRLD